MKNEIIEKRNVCVVTLTNKGTEVNVSKWSYANSLCNIKDFYENELGEIVKFIFEPDRVNINI